MLLSMNWIRDFVDLDGFDLDDLIHRFTLSTAEVEDVYHYGSDISGVVVAKILSVENHPDSKKLHLLKVDTGDRIWDVVCGAPNVRPDMLVAFAKDGAKLGDIEIKPTAVAGVMSYGMCCGADELGLSADRSGLLEVDKDAALGTDIKDVYDIEDTVFEVDNKSLTNRPDLWGHYGIAREFAALTGRKLKPYKTVDLDEFASLPPVEINIEDPEHCYRYSSIKVDNVTKHKSPFNMQIRLFYCGMRGINLLTDLTNYIMLELGQPMHAFDRRRMNAVNVKRFDKPFTFRTLDGNDRAIDENTLMICQGEKPVAVAGIMGGLDSSIMDDTTELLLESACFDGVCIRKSSSRMGLRTDASMRYEKMLDPELTPEAIKRFLALLWDIDEGAKAVSSFSDSYPTKYKHIKLTFDRRFVDRYTGIEITDDRIVNTLVSLGFGVALEDGTFTVDVPSWRATKDVTIPADIIEEITRIYGYDNFVVKTTKSALKPVPESTTKNVERQIKDLFVKSFGMHELHSYIWCDNKKYAEMNIDVEDNIRLLNAMTVDNSVLRNSMIPSLLSFAKDNKGFAPSFGMFEIGRVFKGKRADGTANERKTFGAVLVSSEKSERELFFDLRRMVACIAHSIKHCDFTFENIAAEHNWQHPKNTAAVVIDGVRTGVLCTLHPATLSAVSKKESIACCEIDLDTFCSMEKKPLSYVEVSKYPSIDWDLTFVLPEGVQYKALTSAWSERKNELLRDVSLVDIYNDGDTNSISVRLHFASDERTLQRSEVQVFVDEIIEKLAQRGINLKA
ncbi:MAG: phenylalanine--tRNA ligase subunit beta [Clostridia bacterium]|nr:phenylalanine--tRNA ligase subunit beta [Clostridia bacterium]